MRQGCVVLAGSAKRSWAMPGFAHPGVELLGAQRTVSRDPARRARCSSGSQCGLEGAGAVDELVEAAGARRDSPGVSPLLGNSAALALLLIVGACFLWIAAKLRGRFAGHAIASSPVPASPAQRSQYDRR